MKQIQVRPDPPNALQVEPVEGCNLRCTFCGIQGIREAAGGPYSHMTIETAQAIAASVVRSGWTPRVEFAMHGEPTLHPQLAGLIAIFRAALPKSPLMVTSNGGGLLAPPGPTERIGALMAAGLNVLALDDYQAVRLVPKIRDAYAGPWPVLDYPAQKQANPHRRRRVDAHEIVIIQDISVAATGTHATLTNHSGCAAPPLAEPLAKRCARPFREITVRWDGHVALCCNDWRGTYQCGRVNGEEPLAALWENAAFDAARRRLLRADRDFGPCRGCDAVSYRPGLLPDRMGRHTLPEPDAASEAALAQALAPRPYTLPVLRPWEWP